MTPIKFKRGDNRSKSELVSQMVRGATGPLTSALPLFALPLAGAAFLSSGQFAMWSILASISTVALSLDFGGPAYLASRLDPRHRTRPFLIATAMTCIGTAVVGLISVGAWIPFSRTAAASSFSFPAGLAAIGTITLGSALRSIVQLQAQVALFDHRLGLRNWVLCIHSIAALAVALVVLPATRSAWALPIAWVAAGCVGVITGGFVFWRTGRVTHGDWTVETGNVASGGTYAWARTLANLFRGTLMQADRWVVGAVGGPAVLAAYEMAWRVAALPRFVAENLTFILGLDAARVRASSPEELTQRVAYSIRFSLVVVAVLSAVASIFYACLPLLEIDVIWVAFALLLISHGSIASGSPVSFIGNGIGIPTIDLPYLTFSVSVFVMSAFIAGALQNVYVFIGGITVALLLGNLWFVRYGIRVIRKTVLAKRPS